MRCTHRHRDPPTQLPHYKPSIHQFVRLGVAGVITWAMIPLRLRRAWWKRLMKSARNCLLISFQPVMTLDPFPPTAVLGCESGEDVNPTYSLSSMHM